MIPKDIKLNNVDIYATAHNTMGHAFLDKIHI